MSKNALEVTGDILVAMLQGKQNAPNCDIVAKSFETIYKTVFSCEYMKLEEAKKN